MKKNRRRVVDIQSVLFKLPYSVSKAKAWLEDNNFTVGKVDKTMNYLRFRQLPPEWFVRFETVRIPGYKNKKAIVGYYK
ncbi:MAG: hypothetical protein OEL89_04345 [Candidatus Peregrinibacteria bacterium]|nr:hypothetical protein [Candidatus Peregrinibacteria bacterium]